MPTHCPDCGALLNEGRQGCEQLFYELSASGVLPGAGFDAYCLQHLERYCASPKSYAAHLTRLCCGIEHGGDPKFYTAIQRWLNGRVVLEKPQVLSNLGNLNLAHVKAGSSPPEQNEIALRWVDSVWAAYRPQHELARSWVQQALASSR